MELKVGDYVTGKPDNGYSITTDDMTCGRIVKDYGGGKIRVKVLLHKNNQTAIGDKYDVSSDKFVKIDKPEEVKERVLSQSELDEILAAHKKWLETAGDEGARADLSRADLSDADLSRADLSRAILSRAILSRADLSRAILSRAILSRADLSDADLSRADLSDADLSRAILSHADLSRADLRGTISAKQANFIGANLDFCRIPLSCHSLDWVIDRRIAAQMLYHFCSHTCNDKDVIAIQNAALALANEFHRVGECGKLEEKTLKEEE